MKLFFYYVYFRLYQWSEKREDNFPLIIVLPWLTITMFFNVCTVLSLVTIYSGVDAGYVFGILKSKLVSVLLFSTWALLIWGFLKICRVHEKAFCSETITKYKELGYRDWWVIAYFLGSFAAMALSTWVAGRRLGLH